MIKSSAN